MGGYRWTPDERQQLSQLFKAGYATATIAQALGRTERAVRCQIHGTPRLRRKGVVTPDATYTLAAAAELLGMGQTTLLFWCRRGAFPTALAQHRFEHSIWHLSAAELGAWLRDKASWQAWQPDQIQDAAWRCELRHLRQAWLSTTEARRLLLFSRSGFQGLVNSRRLRGELAGRTRWFKRTTIQHFARVNGIQLEETF